MSKWKEQPCWTCQNACGGCSWSDCLQPVEGWKVERVKKKTVPEQGYRILFCPEYVPDEPFQGVKKFHRLTMHDKKIVRQMHKDGYTYEDIRNETGISMQTICDILNDRK